LPINRDFIGRRFPGGEAYEVGREKIREFARAIGDGNPAYHSVEAAQALGHPDVIAPPTYAITITAARGGRVLGDPGLGLNLALVVHGEQSFRHERPIRAGDQLELTTVITDIRDAGRNELLTLDTELRTVEGELVCTATNTIVSRGTAAGEG
jgi:acyl dehydratase